MISKELVAASSRPLILGILSQKESYGYEIIKKVHELSNSEMKWKDGMLYPVLHKLEHDGLIQSFWQVSDNGRKRKYYKIKPKGKTVLETQKQQWLIINKALNQLWEPLPCSSK